MMSTCCVPTLLTSITASSLLHHMNYQILMYFLYPGLLDLIQSNKMFRFAIVHKPQYQKAFLIACFLQIYSDSYWAENIECNTFYYNYAVKKD